LSISLIPSFIEEKRLIAQGYRFIAGIDEVGRGSLAGPVLAAAIILPTRIKAPWLDQVRDSKLLTPTRRETLSRKIRRIAISVGIGVIDNEIIDARGIASATRQAMKQAIDQLSPPPEYLLIDYVRLPEVSLPQKGVVDGDSLCFSIACASIVAKVSRDRMIVRLDRVYPGYGLAHHKGYGTEEHLSCLRRLGPCPIHRRSFQPVRDAGEK
jgi:ribonuclease HII